MILFEHPDPAPVNRIRHAWPDSGPRVANLDPSRELEGPAPLPWGTRTYAIRPIRHEDGLDLLELALRLEAVFEDGDPAEMLREYRRVVREITRRCWMLLRPRWVPAFLWRLRPNPFRRATLAEVKDILGFFGRCQTTSRVRHREGTNRRLPSTSSI